MAKAHELLTLISSSRGKAAREESQKLEDEGAIRKLKDDLKRAQEEKEELVKKNEELSIESEESKKSISNLMDTNRDLEMKNHPLVEKVQQLRTEKEQAATQNTELSDQHNKLKVEVSKLQKQLETAQGKIKSLDSLLDDMDATNERTLINVQTQAAKEHERLVDDMVLNDDEFLGLNKAISPLHRSGYVHENIRSNKNRSAPAFKELFAENRQIRRDARSKAAKKFEEEVRAKGKQSSVSPPLAQDDSQGNTITVEVNDRNSRSDATSVPPDSSKTSNTWPRYKIEAQLANSKHSTVIVSQTSTDSASSNAKTARAIA